MFRLTLIRGAASSVAILGLSIAADAKPPLESRPAIKFVWTRAS